MLPSTLTTKPLVNGVWYMLECVGQFVTACYPICTCMYMQETGCECCVDMKLYGVVMYGDHVHRKC